MKIYVASSWRNDRQPDIVDILRAQGHEVYDFKNPEPNTGFAWSEIDVRWQNWTNKEYFEALQHPRAEEGFKSDFDAMQWADACVLVMPCGRSAHSEAGWMQGAGKPVFVLVEDRAEPELMYKLFAGMTDTVPGLLEMISNQAKVIAATKQAVIKLNPGQKSKEVDVQTGGLTNIEMLDYLKTLSTFFAKAVCDEYVDITGDKNIREEDFEKYVAFLRKNQV